MMKLEIGRTAANGEEAGDWEWAPATEEVKKKFKWY